MSKFGITGKGILISDSANFTSSTIRPIQIPDNAVQQSEVLASETKPANQKSGFLDSLNLSFGESEQDFTPLLLFLGGIFAILNFTK